MNNILQFKQNLDSISLRDMQNYRCVRFKKQHEAIINSLNNRQYFKWHYEFFKGNLDYKSQAWSIFHSTRSKKIRAFCLVQIEYYDQCFGTSGFDLKQRDV
jgi:hypothetical protein